MAYQQSPMEKFNKNNPFIIIAKKTYDSIIDDIHKFSKNCIKASIAIFIIWALLLIAQVYIMLSYKSYVFPSILIVATLVINLFIIYAYKRIIRYFISDHSSMVEFDRISSLEINDIIALNNEDILKCVNGMYTEFGELSATIFYSNVMLTVYAIFETILIILSLIRFI